MLYRFREAQAAELGLAQRSDRRPRVASSCKDLRQCERWRGEILRDISRKVSKIQDGAFPALCPRRLGIRRRADLLAPLSPSPLPSRSAHPLALLGLPRPIFATSPTLTPHPSSHVPSLRANRPTLPSPAAGLTDYEVRDLNDEINKLLREKHHWENQIIALGGANYKRAAGKITDQDGREVPGQRGYKCVSLFRSARRWVASPSCARSYLRVVVVWAAH